MRTEQSWSSFHQKYGSECTRRSSKKHDHDDDDRVDDRVSGVFRTFFTKKCSSRKLIAPDETTRKNSSRSISSISSSPDGSFLSSRKVIILEEFTRPYQKILTDHQYQSRNHPLIALSATCWRGKREQAYLKYLLHRDRFEIAQPYPRLENVC